MSALLDAAYHVIHDYPGGATSLAPRLHKNPATLSHEATGAGSAKLGLVDALKITHMAGNDLRILNAFAAECGCMVLALPQVADGHDAYRQLATAAREFSEFVGSVADAAADGQITHNELARVDRELGELMACAQAIRATLAAVHEAGKPAASQDVTPSAIGVLMRKKAA